MPRAAARVTRTGPRGLSRSVAREGVQARLHRHAGRHQCRRRQGNRACRFGHPANPVLRARHLGGRADSDDGGAGAEADVLRAHSSEAWRLLADQAVKNLSRHAPVAPQIVYDRTDYGAAQSDGRTAQEVAPAARPLKKCVSFGTLLLTAWSSPLMSQSNSSAEQHRRHRREAQPVGLRCRSSTRRRFLRQAEQPRNRLRRPPKSRPNPAGA